MTKKAGNKLWIIILIIAVIGFVSGAAYFVVMKLQSDGMDDTRSAAYASSSSSTASSKTVNYVEPPVNFVELKKINKEIYAWINIPGTVIDYPILRSAADNAYYLNHTAEGKSSAYGAIYTEGYNDTDFADFNTVIYGHNMKNNTMFGSLPKYSKQEYYEEHSVLYLLTPKQNYKVKLIAGYVTPSDSKVYEFEKTKEERSGLLKTALDNSLFTSGTTVSDEDRLLTLSTCSYEYDNARFVLMGILKEIG